MDGRTGDGAGTYIAVDGRCIDVSDAGLRENCEGACRSKTYRRLGGGDDGIGGEAPGNGIAMAVPPALVAAVVTAAV